MKIFIIMLLACSLQLFAQISQNITIYRGDYKVVTTTSFAVSDTARLYRLGVKEIDYNVPTSSRLISKATYDGITYTYDSVRAKVTLTITFYPDDTQDLSVDLSTHKKTYYYDIESRLKSDTTKKTTVITGNFIVTSDVITPSDNLEIPATATRYAVISQATLDSLLALFTTSYTRTYLDSIHATFAKKGDTLTYIMTPARTSEMIADSALRKSQNLAGLQSPTIARVNLDVYSTGTVNILLDSVYLSMNNILYVSSTFTTETTNKFNTIASALAAWSVGKIILLAPETFSENITLTQDSVYIRGVNKELSRIDTLRISGKDCIIENLSIQGDYYYTNTNTWSWYVEGNVIRDCIFWGNAYNGTPTTMVTYPYTMKSCDFRGGNKVLYFNSTYDRPMKFYDVYVQGDSPTDSSYNLQIISGRIEFTTEKLLVFNRLILDNTTYDIHVSFYDCQHVNILHGMWTAGSTSHWTILTFKGCVLVDMFRSQVANWTLTGKFELDIFDCNVAMTNLVFEVTSSACRMVRVLQLGYASTATISGSKTDTNVHIYNSVFGCAIPTEGLYTNMGNVWNAFIDD